LLVRGAECLKHFSLQTSTDYFGHKNIIKYCNRPFSSAKEMDEALIANHNRVVEEDDVVYMLGDFTLENLDRAKKYFKRLNGHIYILSNAWHHDKRWIVPLIKRDGATGWHERYTSLLTSSGFVILLQPIHILKIENQVVALSHYPQAYWDRKHHGSWHLHGHSHGTHGKDGFSEDLKIDVGVDCFNYTPVEWENLKQIFKLAKGHVENEN